jgi:hypothetical protein
MFTGPLKKIGSPELPDHHHLECDDDCYFYLEYTSGRGFGFSDANSFILNFKKSVLTRGTYQWVHKQNAIREAAHHLVRTLPAEWLQDSTFVPIPPSKAQDHPEYDTRISQVLTGVGNLDVRELIFQTVSLDATHHLEDRHTVQDLLNVYEINEKLVRPVPAHIVLVDDVVTGGTHFKAARLFLRDRFPGVPISALFLARRVFPVENE